MFNTLELNADQTRIRQQELRDMAQRMHRSESGTGSPVLAAVGRHLVALGEKLQRAAHVPEQTALELQTKQA